MGRILLVLDDWPEVGRGLRRLFKRRFEQVLVATTPAQAEEYLGSQEAPPTHLLCDYFLGEGKPLGVDLIPRWRRDFPHLRTVALLSGSAIARMPVPEGVDAVFEKPVDAELLAAFLEDAEQGRNE